MNKNALTNSMLRRFALFAGVAVVLAIVVTTFVTQVQSSPKQPYPLADPAEQVPPEVADKLKAFKRGARADDRAPRLPDAPAPEPTGSSRNPSGFGANLKLSRKVRRMPDGDVFLVGGRTGVCFVSDSGVEEGCTPLENVASGDNVQTVICSPFLDPQTRVVYGIIPEGAADARVRYRDGSMSPLEVVNNTYEVRTTKPASLPAAILWQDESGAREVASNMPLDAYDEPCATPPPGAKPGKK